MAAAPPKSPRQYCTIPRLSDRPRPLGAPQHGLGVVEQGQRPVEVAEAADDERERHPQPGSELGGAGRRQRGRSPDRSSSAAAIETAELASADPIAHCSRARSAASGVVELLSPNRLCRARRRGSASTWSRSSVTLIVASAPTVVTLSAARYRAAAKFPAQPGVTGHNGPMPEDDRPHRALPLCHGSPGAAQHVDRDLRPPQHRRRHRLVRSGGSRATGHLLAEVTEQARTRVTRRLCRASTTRSKPSRSASDGEPTAVPFDTVRFRDVERESVNGEERWTFGRVQSVHAASSPPSTHRSSRAEPRVPRRPGRERQPARCSGDVGRRDGLPRQRLDTKPDEHGVSARCCCRRPSRPRSPASCAAG